MRASRGVTLVELMASVAIAGVLGTVFAASVYWQVSFWIARTDAVAARQTGEAVVQELQARGRATAFGFLYGDNVAGYYPIGQCSSPNSMLTYQDTGLPLAPCTDAGGDRLRLAYGSPWGIGGVETFGSSLPSLSSCNQSPRDLSVTGMSDTPHMPRTGQFSWYLVSGACAGNAPVALTNDLMYTNAEVPTNNPSCPFVVSATSPANPGQFSACTNGMNAGFRMLYANQFSYYTTPAQPDGTMPALWREQHNVAYWSGSPIAYGVENFEVRYGFDTSSVLDGRVDSCPSCVDDPFGHDDGGPYSWCRTPIGTDQGGPCALTDDSGVAISTDRLIRRIVAVYATFTVRSQHRSNSSSADADGFRRWPFATLISLRARSMGI